MRETCLPAQPLLDRKLLLRLVAEPPVALDDLEERPYNVSTAARARGGIAEVVPPAERASVSTFRNARPSAAALDVRASTINEEMELAAAQAIAAVVDPEHLAADYVIPSVFNKEVAPAVANAVADAAHRTGVTRREWRS